MSRNNSMEMSKRVCGFTRNISLIVQERAGTSTPGQYAPVSRGLTTPQGRVLSVIWIIANQAYLITVFNKQKSVELFLLCFLNFIKTENGQDDASKI